MTVTPTNTIPHRDYGFDPFQAPVTSLRDSDQGDGQFWGEDGLSFGDLIDLINPLQHVPGVAALYRKITGDEIAPGARLLGGALFGGIAGAISAIANIVVEDSTGKDIGAHVVAFVTGDDEVETDTTPPSTTFANDQGSSTGGIPYKLAAVSTPTVAPTVIPAVAPASDTPAIATTDLIGATSGAELPSSPVLAQFASEGWFRNATLAPFERIGTTPVPNILGTNGGIGSMQVFTQDGADVAAVLKLYEAYQERARLNAELLAARNAPE